MLVKDLRVKDIKQLHALIDELKAELFMLRFKNSTGQLDQPHKIKTIKKDIAKVYTVIYEINHNITYTNKTLKNEPKKINQKLKEKKKNDIVSPNSNKEVNLKKMSTKTKTINSKKDNFKTKKEDDSKTKKIKEKK